MYAQIGAASSDPGELCADNRSVLSRVQPNGICLGSSDMPIITHGWLIVIVGTDKADATRNVS